MTTSVQLPPRYRIEHREADQPSLILAFADTGLGLRAGLAVQTARHLRTRTSGMLVVVDQETDEVVSARQLSPA